MYLKGPYISVQEGMIAFEGIFRDIHGNVLWISVDEDLHLK